MIFSDKEFFRAPSKPVFMPFQFTNPTEKGFTVQSGVFPYRISSSAFVAASCVRSKLKTVTVA